ncbi:hypothetical protein B0H13DRAFT_1914962 [Mycena leptocephala]|nr:hypothetical protein B0H13DRAFT_1914962 [Mycena leptocephala]
MVIFGKDSSMRNEARVSPTRSSIGLEVGSISPTASAVKFLVDVPYGLKRVGMDGISQIREINFDRSREISEIGEIKLGNAAQRTRETVASPNKARKSIKHALWARYPACKPIRIVSYHQISPSTSMPTRTDRQEAADALQKAFLVNLIAQMEAEQWEAEEWDEGDWDDSDTSSDSSDSSSSGSGWSSSSSSSDGSDLDEPTLAEQYVQGMAELYSEHYLNERREVPKTRSFMRLLLDVYKYERPAYFRSYLRINPDCFDALVTAIADDDLISTPDLTRGARI